MIATGTGPCKTQTHRWHDRAERRPTGDTAVTGPATSSHEDGNEYGNGNAPTGESGRGVVVRVGAHEGRRAVGHQGLEP